ncbi:MAG: efflux RND transporter periplasmic adaptor subunit [Bilifractor sp.]|jgi:HlyD family secretion protein
MMKKNKKAMIVVVLVVIAAAAALLYFAVFRKQSSSDNDSTAYVETVSNLMDTGVTGLVNQYAGVVESQETWSVSRNSDAEVAEVTVKVGDTVKKGDVLFVYDISSYQSQLDQANIDLQRLNNELETMNSTLAELQKQQKKAAASEQANYTIQVQQQQLSIQQKQLEIQSKQADIDKLNENISNNQVTAGIDGVVKSISDGTSQNADSTDTSFITIMKTGDLRVKGTVNEQNIGSLTEGSDVIIRSRVDSEKTWKGKITKIDTENAESNQNEMYYSSWDSSTTSSKYPFYVDLDSSDGLMMGQHVYIEPDYGEQDTVDKSEGIWIGSFYVDQTDPDHPFVWADNGKGKLEKRDVTLGEKDEMMDEVQITDGLSKDDSIAYPDGTLFEGEKTAPMSEMPVEDVLSDSAYTGDVMSESVTSMSSADEVVSDSADLSSSSAEGIVY